MRRTHVYATAAAASAAGFVVTEAIGQYYWLTMKTKVAVSWVVVTATLAALAVRNRRTS